jgi:hypothetical protein
MFGGYPSDRGSDVALLAAGAVALAVLTRRWWRWQLPAGTLLMLPVALLKPESPTGLVVQQGLGWIGGTLLLVGVLGAAAQLLADGFAGYGAAVAGVAVGARLLGAVMPSDRNGVTLGQPVWLALTAVALVVTGLAVPLHPRPGTGPVVHSGRWIGLRVTGAGLVVAAAALLPVAWAHGWVAAVAGVTEDQMHRNLSATLVLVGLLGLAAALVALSVAGPLPLVVTAATGLTLLGLAAPLLGVAVQLDSHPGARWTALLLGTAVGAVAAASRYRAAAAGFAAVVVGGLLIERWPLDVFPAHGFLPIGLSSQPRTWSCALLLGLIAATAVALAGTAATALAGLTSAAARPDAAPDAEPAQPAPVSSPPVTDPSDAAPAPAGPDVADPPAGDPDLAVTGIADPAADDLQPAGVAGWAVPSPPTGCLAWVQALPVVLGPALSLLAGYGFVLIWTWDLNGAQRQAWTPGLTPGSCAAMVAVGALGVIVTGLLTGRRLRARRAATARVPSSYLPY